MKTKNNQLSEIIRLYKVFLDQCKIKTRLSRLSDNSSETIAAHSWSASVLAMVVAKMLELPAEEELALLKLVIMHDTVEALSGDIPSSMYGEYKELAGYKELVEEQARNLLPQDLGIAQFADSQYAVFLDPKYKAMLDAVDKLDWVLQQVATCGLVHGPKVVKGSIVTTKAKLLAAGLDDSFVEAVGKAMEQL